MISELTPETLKAAYDLLRTTPPFRGWRLPKSDEVGFTINPVRGDFGHYSYTQSRGHEITLSDPRHGHLFSVLETMAHEMVHMRQFLLDRPLEHDDFFFSAAARICRVHGFDPKRF